MEGVAVAIRLDIANAFNSLPWSKIRETLEVKRISNYLRLIANSYLEDRKLILINRKSRVIKKAVSCGVSQGSALGPQFWITTYNALLQKELPEMCTAICYADDTLLVAVGESVREIIARADVALAIICRKIRNLGLRISPAKTETVVFARKKIIVPENTTVTVEGHLDKIKTHIKYWGLTIDKN